MREGPDQDLRPRGRERARRSEGWTAIVALSLCRLRGVKGARRFDTSLPPPSPPGSTSPRSSAQTGVADVNLARGAPPSNRRPSRRGARSRRTRACRSLTGPRARTAARRGGLGDLRRAPRRGRGQDARGAARFRSRCPSRARARARRLDGDQNYGGAALSDSGGDDIIVDAPVRRPRGRHDPGSGRTSARRARALSRPERWRVPPRRAGKGSRSNTSSHEC